MNLNQPKEQDVRHDDISNRNDGGTGVAGHLTRRMFDGWYSNATSTH